MPRAKEGDNAAKTSAAAIRIRENQRRSRARRKEYVEGMQRKLQEYETKGVAATLEMQQAARDVAIENSRLRLLLAHSGVSGLAIDSFLQSFKHQDAAEAEVQMLRMQADMPPSLLLLRPLLRGPFLPLLPLHHLFLLLLLLPSLLRLVHHRRQHV
ncbi:hypothetical protein ESCO_005964 [Escovopsis weberi]|uniref:BZIP domain-containing protein n=1 Tax=Escovopsis weberi TaxID=150374 RepID=A0A0M9VS24_ESCWE|nr:hypothetical protein ESCO_005964 [Escovopsis weberi]